MEKKAKFSCKYSGSWRPIDVRSWNQFLIYPRDKRLVIKLSSVQLEFKGRFQEKEKGFSLRKRAETQLRWTKMQNPRRWKRATKTCNLVGKIAAKRVEENATHFTKFQIAYMFSLNNVFPPKFAAKDISWSAKRPHKTVNTTDQICRLVTSLRTSRDIRSP